MESPELDLATCEYDVQRKQSAEQRRARLLGALALEEARLNDLARQLRIEEEDVERLEGMSLAAFVATLRGIKDERLKAERAEYVAAKLRYDECAAALEALRTQVADVGREVDGLRGAETRYEAALAAREQQVLASGSAVREQVMDVARRIGVERARIHELDEAANAANETIQALKAVHESLGSAASWGAWDTWGGGGLISTSIKHDHIDKARRSAGVARQRLQRLNIELADVGLAGGGLDVQMGDFLSFADYFLDGFWADLAVQNRIEGAQARVLDTGKQVVALRTRLREDQHRATRQIEQLEDERRTLIRTASVETT
ncbi:hypothetical protein [Longimicrobium sp.]|uniref:hypothetical protein n=1 Tax=Longimicrobium sp. TaxID=2029185 RepID=UPI002E34ED54|nr:hypothetical protein [Longimicrobium sp.]HEX6041012.1 hypothetical protein [Longimicrobium sp.]